MLEKKLRESEERYDLAVQGLSVGIWDWDISANQVYSSQRLKEIMIGQHRAGLQHPNSGDQGAVDGSGPAQQ